MGPSSSKTFDSMTLNHYIFFSPYFYPYNNSAEVSNPVTKASFQETVFSLSFFHSLPICIHCLVFSSFSDHPEWMLSVFLPQVASLGVTTFTLCALCIDRFRAATNVQMYYEMIENCSSTTAKLAVIWVGALLLALPEVVLRQLSKEDLGLSGRAPAERCVIKISPDLPDTIYVLALTYDSARLWWYFGCYFCLPTLFTITCSLVTARKIRKAEKACTRGNKRQIQLESQMNCTVVALTILYGFCIIPENICNIVTAYMATGVSQQTMDLLNIISQFLLFFKSCVTPVLLFCLCKPFSRAFMECCCCCCDECIQKSSTVTSDDNDNEYTTELELSPFSTIRREMSTFASVGTHCWRAAFGLVRLVYLLDFHILCRFLLCIFPDWEKMQKERNINYCRTDFAN